MSRTWTDDKRQKYERDGYTLLRWGSPRTGKWWKRQHNKALRSYYRGTGGKEHSVIGYARWCQWKLT